MANYFARAVDTTLVVAALSTTLLIWRRSSPTAADTQTAPVIHVTNWKAELARDHRVGPKDAPFTLAVWTDYECPACRKLETELTRLRARLGDSLAVVYRYYPLPAHRLAFPAALAAECAFTKGAFAQMHETLFDAQIHGDTLPVDSLARATNAMTGAQLRSCMAATATVAAVRTDQAIGDSLGFKGTPYLQMGDQLSMGGMTAQDLEKALRKAAR